MRNRRYLRLAALALAILALAWLLPYLLGAERYRHLVQSRLEQALGRQVTFGSIAFKLVPRPGFSLHKVVVRENPAFGSEPFARVDQIDCDLAVWSLLRGRVGLARLGLQGATVSLVRDGAGHWNVEPALAAATYASSAAKITPALNIEVEDARLNFKVGAVTKPFAVTDVAGRVSLDRSSGVLGFDLAGSPLRTDLGLPSPGRISLAGRLTPSPGNTATLDARLNTRGALLYDWIPLAVGRNPQIYGLLDADVRLTGSVRLLNVSAQARLMQLRRWESLPPSGSFPVTLAVQGRLDRDTGDATLNSLQADFGQSQVSLAGTVIGVTSDPVLQLSAAVSRSRWDDFLNLSGRLAGWPRGEGVWNLTGAVEASARIAGPWSAPLLSGSMTTHRGVLAIGAVRLPISDAEIRFDGRRIELLPARITATPNLALTAEATLNLPDGRGTQGKPRSKSRGPHPQQPVSLPGYQVEISARSASSHEVLSLARALGLKLARDVDAQGAVTAAITLSHAGWPPAPPTVAAEAEVRATRLLVPGLAKPVEIHNARLELQGDQFTADPIAASFAGAEFTGRIEHAGGRSQPWTFVASAQDLDLAQAATWLEALGQRPALPWFAHIPGLSTLAERQAAGTDLFKALNASGSFSTPALTYGRTTLRGLGARVEIAHRVVHVTGARFRVSTGRGQSTAQIDLSGLVPQLAADFSLEGLRVENWTSHLPPQLADLRGGAAFNGHMSALGTSQGQLRSSLEGHLRLRLFNLELGHFDPARTAARAAGWGELAPSHLPLVFRSAELDLELQNRRMALKPARFELGGAVFQIDGQLGFDHSALFQSTVDLQHVNRRWTEDRDPAASHVAHFLLAGPLDGLTATMTDQAEGLPR